MNKTQAGLIRHIFDDFKFREALAWALDAHAVRERLDADEFFEHDDALGALYTSIADHVLEDWPTRLRTLEQEVLNAMRRIAVLEDQLRVYKLATRTSNGVIAEMRDAKVIIAVRGGVAEVEEAPDWLDVEIHDLDEGGYCPECGQYVPRDEMTVWNTSNDGFCEKCAKSHTGP